MENLESLLLGLPFARLLLALWLAVLFVQSGLDKILDRSGNLDWLQGHFAQSPLAGMVPVMLSIITFTELAAGLCSALGAVLILVNGSQLLALMGAQLSALNLLMLFLGQRLAKDYAGAASLVPYFILTLIGIYLFAS